MESRGNAIETFHCVLGFVAGRAAGLARRICPKRRNPPRLRKFLSTSSTDFFKIPRNVIMAEAVGVAINSKGHIFILNRGNHPLLEFTADGAFVGSFGEGSPIFRVPHSIRFDAQDNLWYVNAGDNLVVKFDRKRRVQQALGRREEPWVYLTHGIERAIPLPANFYQPTDTVVGPDGSTYVTDGYGNSRVVKFTQRRQSGEVLGRPRTQARPVQHAAQHRDRRELDSICGRPPEQPRAGLRYRRQLQAGMGARRPRVVPLHHPGPQSGDLRRQRRDASTSYDLNGKLLGEFGKLGRLPGWFDSIHALACPDEKTLYPGRGVQLPL